ncbi:hypothetical protein OCEANICA350_12365 [Oceanicaulis sp. 350]|nr:hypothetical protein OCEANICA350_12365 [Oceanicaulis sp. 350]
MVFPTDLSDIKPASTLNLVRALLVLRTRNIYSDAFNTIEKRLEIFSYDW